MKIVKDLLEAKGYDVWTIHPDAMVYDALVLMAEKNVGALVVVEGERPVGVVSERDYARNMILKGRTSRDTAIREIMSPLQVTVRPEQDLEECMELMTDKRVRHLPVIQGEKLIGMVSIGDIVKGIISTKEFMIEQLEKYIKGHR
jgi:CBS domain-containing protein